MIRNEKNLTERPGLLARPALWRGVLLGGLVSLGLVAAVACGATTDSGEPTRPLATTGEATATNHPNTVASATQAPVATASLTAAPTRISGAPTPTRFLRATATPYVPANSSLFATSTPIPRIQATVIRPTPTRFVAPTATPFTGSSSGSGSSSVPTPTPGARSGASDRTSQIQNFTLETFKISVGTTVTWTNLDSVDHTSTSGISPNFDGAFNSQTLSQNSTFSHTFNNPGAFPYFCSIHPSMTAVITVQ